MADFIQWQIYIDQGKQNYTQTSQLRQTKQATHISGVVTHVLDSFTVVVADMHSAHYPKPDVGGQAQIKSFHRYDQWFVECTLRKENSQ